MPVSQPSKIGEFQQALKATKIKDATLSELQAILRGCMIMVGLRAANLPAPEETAVLLKFIYSRYENLTVKEIQLAFEKAVAGELEESANCYENFSCEYFGRIMAAYKKWASQKWNENQMHVVKPKEIEPPKETDWNELAETYYQDYLNGRFNFRIMPAELYIACLKHDLPYVSEDAYEDWLPDAENYLINDLVVESQGPVSSNERHDIEQKIQKIRNGECETLVINMAKKMTVAYLFKQAKKQKRKSLF